MITKMVSTLSHFEKNSKLTEYLNKHPTEETSTEEKYEEEFVIFILSGLLKLNHSYGRPHNTDQEHLSTDQSKNLVLMTN